MSREGDTAIALRHRGGQAGTGRGLTTPGRGQPSSADTGHFRAESDKKPKGTPASQRRGVRSRTLLSAKYFPKNLAQKKPGLKPGRVAPTLPPPREWPQRFHGQARVPQVNPVHGDRGGAGVLVASRCPMSSGGHPGATPLAAGLAITKRRSRNVAEVSFQICQRIVGAIQKGNHSGDEKISLSLDPFNICWPEVMC